MYYVCLRYRYRYLGMCTGIGYLYVMRSPHNTYWCYVCFLMYLLISGQTGGRSTQTSLHVATDRMNTCIEFDMVSTSQTLILWHTVSVLFVGGEEG
jgi:hypothetical protein